MWLVSVVICGETILVGFLFLIPDCIVVGVPYSIYVWEEGWDPAISGCDTSKFLEWDSTSPCFTHTWNTPEKRSWLWKTCNRVGREIDTIYFYGMKVFLSSRNCSNPGIQLIKETLAEGHGTVSGIRIFALFSDGGVSVPEKDQIPNVVWYNENCATGIEEKIDGVAVNNEDWDKQWNAEEMRAYLDNLDLIRQRANEQLPVGSLRTHFSVGWHWGKDSNGDDLLLEWNGKTQPVMRHFIDIFSSLDVQVAFITADAITERYNNAEANYALENGKEYYANVYLNKNTDTLCQTTFFPFPMDDTDCASWTHQYKTETAMFQQLDEFQITVPRSRVNLHYFRGIYSSGGHPDWPSYN